MGATVSSGVRSARAGEQQTVNPMWEVKSKNCQPSHPRKWCSGGAEQGTKTYRDCFETTRTFPMMPSFDICRSVPSATGTDEMLGPMQMKLSTHRTVYFILALVGPGRESTG